MYWKSTTSPYNALRIFCVLVALMLLFIVVPSVNVPLLWNSTITTKFLCFILIMCLALVCQTLNWRNLPKGGVNGVDVMVFVIALYVVLNRYLIQTDYSYSIKYYEFIYLSMLYWMLRCLHTATAFKYLLLAAIVGADMQIIVGNLQLVGIIGSNNINQKITGSFFNSGPYAGFLASVVPISLYAIKKKTFFQSLKLSVNVNKVIQIILIINVVGTLLIIPALRSRAAFLAIILSSAAVYAKEIKFFLLKKFRFSGFKSVFVLLSTVLIGFFVLLYLKRESTNGRALILKATSRIIQENFWVGVGFDRFKSHYMNFQGKYLADRLNFDEAFYADNVYYAFNEFLQFFAENGLIGIILLCVFIYLLRYVQRNEISEVTFCGILSISIFSLFSYASELLPIKLNFVLYISILISNYMGHKFSPQHISQNLYHSFKYVYIVLTISVVAFSLNFAIIRFKGYKTWREASSDYSTGLYVSSNQKFEYIAPLFINDGEFLITRAKVLFFLGDYHTSSQLLMQAKHHINNTVLETSLGDNLIKLKRYAAAEQAYKAALNMVPNRYYTRYLLMELYKETNQYHNATLMANDILALKTKVPSEAVEAIKEAARKYLHKSKIKLQ